jgi:alpha-L-rhamnosidase
LAILAPAASAGVEVKGLSCEYLANPVGIDVSRPRLSWRLESAERGARQTAFQVLVADDPQRLAADEGDLWDSGKIRSGETLHVEYAGKALASGQRCWWKVRSWDGQDRASRWSEPAQWEMGLVAASDWKAQWIGRDEPPPTAESNPLATAQWIWFPEGNPAQAAPVGSRYFRRTFVLPEGRAVRRATCFATADNQFVLYVNGTQAATANNFHVASAADVQALVQPGRNVLAVAATNVGDTDNPAGLIVALRIEFGEGEPLLVVSDGKWRSAASAGEGWEKPAADDSTWKSAKALGPVGMAPWGKIALSDEDRRLPARMLRKEFKVTKKVRQARAYLCGLGYYELHLNGKKVGDRVLDPPLTDYDQKVFYVTYDVTGRLVQGPNVVGVVLGNGRYFAPRLQVPTPTRTYGYPKLLLQMHVTYDDGSADRLVSDASWKLTTEGPIRANNDYDGEEYDARREMPGWSRPGFDDSGWSAAQRVAAPKGRLAAPTIPPMRVTETVAPARITSPRPGVWLVDMGQNLVGWCRLKVRGPAGTRVELRHAETLGPDGSLYVANLRSARATDIYVLKGQGEETYEPHFTYHGFRYVEVRGYAGTLDASSIQARVVHTDLRPAGRFECSHALVNRIHKNIFWGVRGNYLSVPTDCPQRDERQGWQGDRAGEARGESFLFDVAPLYAKWLDDIRESQRPDGNLSDVCPAYWPFYSGNVTWPSAYVIIPGTLYRQYGDRRVLAEHYPSMRKWLDFMGTFVKDGITDRDTYGDWCVPPEDPKLIHSNDPARKTAGTLLATAYLYHDLGLAAGYAELLGKPDEAAELGRRRQHILAAFDKKFFNERSATYANGSQTSSVLPLAFEMVPREHQQAVFDRLVENIMVKTKGHIGTGLVGGQWLMQTLTRHGRPDVALRLVTNDDYPSWGYMIRRGATTIWELWNGDTADPAMNSHNHVMLVGDLTAWLYEDLAGIRSDPAAPGFRRLIMRPQPVAGLDWCRAAYPSACGSVESAWRIADGQFRWSIVLPANTSATIFVPASDPALVREGSGPAGEAKGVEFLRAEARRAVYRIGSGRYEFSAPCRNRDVASIDTLR